MFLGLDLGTTNIKALVVSELGEILSEGSVPVERFYTKDQGVEQDLDQIWTRTCLATREAVANVDAKRIRAIGVSSQGAAYQWLDADQQPVGPVVSWLDGRGSEFAKLATEELGEEYFVERTGRRRCGTTTGQLFRLRKQSPELFAVPKNIGFVGDLIVSRLCGRRAHDATSLSIAAMLNPSLAQVDPDLATRLGTSLAELPDLLPVTESAGMLLQSAARQTGLPAKIPVSAAVHDQYAAGIGAGSVNAGDVYLGTGTAWVLVANMVTLSRPVTAEAFVCPHPIPGLFGQLLSMGNGGSALQWALSLIGEGQLGRDEIDRRLESIAPGSEGLVCWPLLVPTEQTSQLDRAGGRLDGIRLAHTGNHLMRAVIEGLGCELARYLESLTAGGINVGRLVVCGDAAASRITPQIIADITGLTVACVSCPSASAFGASVIARSILHGSPDLALLSRSLAPAKRTIGPGANAAVYRDLQGQYMAAFKGCH